MKLTLNESQLEKLVMDCVISVLNENISSHEQIDTEADKYVLSKLRDGNDYNLIINQKYPNAEYTYDQYTYEKSGAEIKNIVKDLISHGIYKGGYCPDYKTVVIFTQLQENKKRINEGIYDYPDTIDQIILCAENDRECYDISWQLVQSLMKKVRKGVELSADQLSNSSWMKKFQQFCFRKFKQYQEDYDKDTSPKLFRDWWAEKMIEDVKYEIGHERRNTEKSEQ